MSTKQKATIDKQYAAPLRELKFASLGALLDYNCATPNAWRNPYSDKQGRDNTETRDLAEACEMARLGTWKSPHMDKLAAATRMLATNDSVRQIQLVPDVIGVRPNVPAFCAGMPVSMFDAVALPSDRRIVRVLVNRSYSYDITPSEAIEAGALVLEFLSKLELEQNVSTELDVAFFGECGPDYDRPVHITVTVKRAGQVMDLSEIAFVLAHPSYLRRILFRTLETLPASEYETSGYGTPYEPKGIGETADVYIPGLDHKTRVKPVRDAINSYLARSV